MGAWGSGSFENDCALDWLMELLETNDLSYVEATFSEVLDEELNFLDVDLGCNTLAAAELIARLEGAKNSPAREIASLEEWIGENSPSVPDELLQLCHLALERVTGRESELVELWEEAGEESLNEWLEEVRQLRARLTETRKTV